MKCANCNLNIHCLSCINVWSFVFCKSLICTFQNISWKFIYLFLCTGYVFLILLTSEKISRKNGIDMSLDNTKLIQTSFILKYIHLLIHTCDATRGIDISFLLICCQVGTVTCPSLIEAKKWDSTKLLLNLEYMYSAFKSNFYDFSLLTSWFQHSRWNIQIHTWSIQNGNIY